MPEDLKVSQIGSSPLPPPFRVLHSPGVRKHCQIIFACYFRKSSIAAEQMASTIQLGQAKIHTSTIQKPPGYFATATGDQQNPVEQFTFLSKHPHSFQEPAPRSWAPSIKKQIFKSLGHGSIMTFLRCAVHR